MKTLTPHREAYAVPEIKEISLGSSSAVMVTSPDLSEAGIESIVDNGATFTW